MRRFVLGEFEQPAQCVEAVRRLRDGGVDGLDAYSPHPLPGIEDALRLPRSTAFGVYDGAYAVVGQNCATGYYSFGHEIGHLQGARHNPEADGLTLPFAYGHGFQNNVAPRWRTIMCASHTGWRAACRRPSFSRRSRR